MPSRGWIPLAQNVHTNARVIAAAKDLTGGDVDKMVGHLARLWSWALDHREDGDLSGLDNMKIAEIMGWPYGPKELARMPSQLRMQISEGNLSPASALGERSVRAQSAHAERIVSALSAHVLLTPDRRIHDWMDYAGELVSKRQRDRERKREDRKRRENRAASNGQGGLTPLDTTGAAGPVGGPRPTESGTLSAGRPHVPDRTATGPRPDRTPPPPVSAGQPGTTGSRVLSVEEARQQNEAKADEIVEGATGPWRMALEGLRENAREQQRMGAFVTYYADTRLEVRGDTSYVVVPNVFARDWLRSKHLPTLQGAIGAITGTMGPDVRVVLEEELPTVVEGAQAREAGA